MIREGTQLSYVEFIAKDFRLYFKLWEHNLQRNVINDSLQAAAVVMIHARGMLL